MNVSSYAASSAKYEDMQIVYVLWHLRCFFRSFFSLLALFMIEFDTYMRVPQNFALRSRYSASQKIRVIARERYQSRWKPSGKAILGVHGWTTSSTTRHYCRLMYFQSRPRWLGPGERASEPWRNETKRTEGPHRRRAPVADRRDRDEPSSREVFSADRVAESRATARVPLCRIIRQLYGDNVLRRVFISWIDKLITDHGDRLPSCFESGSRLFRSDLGTSETVAVIRTKVVSKLNVLCAVRSRLWMR